MTTIYKLYIHVENVEIIFVNILVDYIAIFSDNRIMSYSNNKYLLISVNPEQNRNRFYSITIEHDLFGFSLTRCWGRIGTKGKRITKTYETEELVKGEVEKLLRVRDRHGYIKKNKPRQI